VDATPKTDSGPESSAAITIPQSANPSSLTSGLPAHIAALFSMHVIEGHYTKLSARLNDADGDRVRRRRCAEIISQDLWEHMQ
jgi:hypothetical protein